jgi:CubicO group peptidase (beta-lactamase class C family)
MVFLAQVALALGQSLTDFLKDSLDGYMQRVMQMQDIAGAAVLVLKDGNVLVEKGYGVKKMGTNDKIDAQTLFMIGSNTKAFTGYLLAALHEEGVLNMNDKVKQYLPDFKMKNDYLTEEITLTDLITHRMGMETFQGDFMYWSSKLDYKGVMQHFGKLKPSYGFREKWGYTNAGYSILALCMEKASGKNWDRLMQEYILNPLGMQGSLTRTAEMIKANNYTFAHSEVKGKTTALPITNIDNLGPAASVCSSISDMKLWVNAWLQADGKLVEKAKKRVIYPYSIVSKRENAARKANYQLYGLGWFLEDIEGMEMISHTGGVNGFVTSVTMIPKLNLGIVVLTNTDHNNAYEAIKRDLLDLALSKPYQATANRLSLAYKKGKVEKENWYKAYADTLELMKKARINLTLYTGTFVNELYGKVEIKINNGILEASFEQHPNLKAQLFVLQGNRTICYYNDPVMGTTIWNWKLEDKIGFDLKVDDFLEFGTYRFEKTK